MTDDIGDQIIQGMQQAVDYMKGNKKGSKTTVKTVIAETKVDVKAIRQSLNKTQKEFAELFGFSLSTLRGWEQGQRQPEKPTKLLLMMLRDRPEFVQEYVEQLG